MLKLTKKDTISKTSSDESSDESRGKVNKKNKHKEVDPEEDSISKTTSDEFSDEPSVKVSEFLPLTIGTKTVITQGIALSAGINGNKYINSMLQNKYCMLKRSPYKGVWISYIVTDVYINKHNDRYFFDISNSNELRKISTDEDIRVTFDTWNLYRPSTGSYVDISELFATCIYRKIIYNCRPLIK